MRSSQNRARTQNKTDYFHLAYLLLRRHIKPWFNKEYLTQYSTGVMTFCKHRDMSWHEFPLKIGPEHKTPKLTLRSFVREILKILTNYGLGVGVVLVVDQ